MEPPKPSRDLFPIQNRPSKVWDQIRKFNRKRDPLLRAKKFSLMSQSSFAFFRGTDHLFWADLGQSGLLETFGGAKDTRLWISADLHCDNFGSFTDATGRLVYGLNDFDESVVADYQYDLWRLGVSLVLAGRENHSSATGKLVEACALGYWRELKRCRWYPDLRHAPWDEEQASGHLRHFLSHTRKQSGFQPMLERWTQAGKEGPRFKVKGNSDLEVLPRETAKKLEKSLHRYAEGLKPWPAEKPKRFEILDVARRLNAGIGSVDLQRYYALVKVKAEGDGACLILDIKQQVEPSPWKYLSKKSRKKTDELCGGHQGLRADLACRALSLHPDPWLGHLELQGDDYVVWQRSPYKGLLSNAMIDGDTAYQLGAILARTHCRAKESFAKKAFALIREDKKAFRQQISALSHAYADQVELDYQAFLKMKKEK